MALTIQNITPAPNSVDAVAYEPISFEIVDPGVGVDASKTLIWVEGHPVWSGDADYGQDNYSVTKTAITDGYRYEVMQNPSWPAQSQVVFKVYAENTGNTEVLNADWMLWFGTLILLADDQFDDGTTLPVIPGVGTVSESGGLMHLDTTTSENSDWYSSVARKGVVPYMSFNSEGYLKIILETEITYLAAEYGSERHIFWGGYLDDYNCYCIYTYDGVTFGAYRIQNNGWTGLGEVTTGGLPVKLRLEFNLQTNEVYYQYWNGSSWVTWNTQTIAFMPDRMFWYNKTWGGTPWFETEYSYGKIYAERTLEVSDDINLSFYKKMGAWDYESYPTQWAKRHDFPGEGAALSPGPVRQPTNSIGPFPSAEVDGPEAHWTNVPHLETPNGLILGGHPILRQGLFPRTTGPSRHTQPEEGGAVHIPGPPGQFSEDRVGPIVTTSPEDVQGYYRRRPYIEHPFKNSEPFRQLTEGFPTAGGDVRHGYPRTGQGYHIADVGETTKNEARRVKDTAEPTDEERLALGFEPDYSLTTVDSENHNHFLNRKVKRAFLYDRTGEPWSDPITSALTGYAADGLYYSAGTPTGAQAPWATELASNNRSSRFTFPEKSLIVITIGELIIFDLDDFPNNLDVWMRFELGPSGTFYMLGRIEDSLEDVVMVNGNLVVVTDYNGTENGGLMVLDFKKNDQSAGILVRSDNHWWFNSGKTIVNRNEGSIWTTSGAGTLRLPNEHCYHVTAKLYPHNSSQWGGFPDGLQILVGGEELNPVLVELWDNQPGIVYHYPIGDLVPQDQDFNRAMQGHFDKSGWLWLAFDKYLIRNVFDYVSGVIVADSNQQYRTRYGNVELPEYIDWLTDAGDWIFAGTAAGVYAINRYTFDWHLAWSVDNGARGISGSPGDGDIALGRDNAAIKVHTLGTPYADFIEWTNSQWREGCASIVRISDNLILGQLQYPQLQEDGAYFAFSVIV